ncbi:hypothetical protein FRC18_010054 [Serendipita sp. 400]|nr:hypothetical protein FRC18_010054 [Serendipita sp. 400]
MRTVPAPPPHSSYTGLSQTNAVDISDIQQVFERNPLPPPEVAFLRALGIEVPEDPNHLEAFLRDVARILGPAQSDLDDQLGNDPAEPHPGDQVGDGPTEPHSHEHEGDTLMDDSRNHVVRWDSHMAFGGTSLDWGFPALGGDAEKQPIQQTNNVGASTSASSGVSKAPPKARTAGRSIFGGGSDNPAHRYICETCRKEGYAKFRFPCQYSLDRHQARHIGKYANAPIVAKESVARIMHSIISKMPTASISNVTTATAPNITIILARIREFVLHVPTVERTGNRRERRGRGCGRIHHLQISVVI